MTERIIMPSTTYKLIRALVIGFFLAFAVWAVTFLSFVFTSATLEVIGNALQPGSAVAVWLIGLPRDPAKSGGILLATEFVANWIFYAGLVLVINLIIKLFLPSGGSARRGGAQG